METLARNHEPAQGCDLLIAQLDTRMSMSKPIIAGAVGAGLLLAIYFAVLSLSESIGYAISQFSEMWYWVFLLAAGFGTQLGLHVYIRTALKRKNAAATAGVAASGGISTVAMVACCVHHVTDVLPMLGLSAAAVFLVDYQLSFILLGVFSNLVGVTIMLTIIQKHGLHSKSGVLGTVFSFNMKRVRDATLALAVVAVALSFLSSGSQAATLGRAGTETAAVFELPAKLNKQNRVTVKVKPIEFDFGKPAKFSVSLNTHSGSLDFDLTEICVLEDDKGRVYRPTSWEGSPPEGHHRSGTLSFPEIAAGTKSIKLTMKNVYDVPERVFEWVLR